MKIILLYAYRIGDHGGFRRISVDSPMHLSDIRKKIIDCLVVENPDVWCDDIEITDETVFAALSLWDYVSTFVSIAVGMFVAALLRLWLGW